ncbi:MAG: hypothetical protein P8M32_00315 [Phycisphaerales bacterium]|nr:hypothetical protein [Phycisphaerales bacterium]
MFFLAILILAASTTPDTNESDVAPQFRPLVSKDIYTGSLNILLFSKGMCLRLSNLEWAIRSPSSMWAVCRPTNFSGAVDSA